MERKYEKEYSIQDIWQMFAKTDKQMAETDKRLDKQFAETDKRLDKMFAETDKRFKELSKQLGGIGNSNGDFAEEFFFNGFDSTMQVNKITYDYIDRNKKRKIKNIQCEYDIVLINTNNILVVEVKYKLNQEQVIKFYEKSLPRFKQLFHEYKDYTIMGAMASLSIDSRAKEVAEKNGILLFTQSGNNIKRVSSENIVLQTF